MIDKNLGEYIRKARNGESLREFARKCEISHTHLDSIEKGYDPRTKKKVSITLDTLEKLSKATGYSVSFLLGIKDSNYLYIPPELEGTGIAFDKSEGDLTQDEIDKIAEFVKFVKSQRKN